MLNILRLDQDFGWKQFSSFNIVDDTAKFATLPSPKIVLMNDNKWFDYDRSNVDACIFWTSESLAFERSLGHPIVKLTNKDYVYSGSAGPNSSLNLLYYLLFFTEFYSERRYRRFIPKNEIFNNNLLCTLGNSNLERSYIFCKLFDENLINRNISYSYGLPNYSMRADASNEILGQDSMYKFVRANVDKLPKDPRKLDLDWRLLKLLPNYYNPKYTNIFPTNAYLDSSLVYVKETLSYNKEFFITEKTIKGLISGRPCIIISCQYFLKYLQSLGFRTFDEIIDESYDDIENLKDRIDCSITVAKEYIKSNVLNHPKKLSKIQEITNHNLQVLFNSNWSKNINQAIANVCNTLGVNINK